MSEPLLSRYPGTSPFDDSPEDVSRFFGRDEEAEELYLRVLSVPLLVQFGMSGLGKTSLLHAGLFPRLRQKPFLPVMVRLNDAQDSLIDSVVRSMQKSCDIEGLKFTPGDTTGLWELLSTTTIFRDDLLLTPVLVFDQFEEVFTLRDAAFRASTAAELGAIAAGMPPARIQGAAKPRRQNVKIVISLREDYVGSLEEFSAAIPGLFQERLRLEPFSERAARDAVTRPALLEGAFDSPRFELEPAALDALIQYLRGRSGVIEPIQLQLLSRHAESIARGKAGGEPVRLTLDDFRGRQSFASVLENFYRDTLRKIPPVQRKHAARLCEEGLLGADGHRLMLEERQIQREFAVRPETLLVLTQEKLVRREQRMESVFYEISHDRLAESIFNARSMRVPKIVKQIAAFAGIAVLIVVGLLVFFNVRIASERNSAEDLIGFLIGEQFLGEVRDLGSSTLLEQVQTNLDHSAGAEGRPPLIRGLALRGRGDVKRLQGDVAGSVRLYQQALETFEEEDADSLREIARAHERLGLALQQQRKLADALAQSEAADGAWRRVVAAVPDAEQRLEDCDSLADSLLTTGFLRERLGQRDRALADAEAAVDIVSNVLFGPESASEPCRPVPRQAEPYPDAEALHALSRAALLRALVLDSPQGYEGAVALAHEARALRPSSLSARKYALEALSWRAYAAGGTNAQRSLDDYRRIQREAEEMRRADPDNRLWQRERAITLQMIGRGIGFCHQSGSCIPMPPLEDAEAVILEAIATLRALAQLDPNNVSLQADIFWALLEQADVLALEPERAAERLDVLEHAEAIHGKLQKDPESDAMLGYLRARQADARYREPVAAAGAGGSAPALDAGASLAAARQHVRRWPADPAGYTVLSRTNRQESDAAVLNAALHAAQIAAWLSPQARERQSLLNARMHLGQVLYGQGRVQESLEMTTEAVVVAEALVREEPQTLQYQAVLGLARCAVGLDRRELKQDGWEEAIRGGILHIRKAALQAPQYWTEVAFWQEYLGDELLRDGRQKDAAAQYRFALASWGKIPPSAQTDATRQAMQRLSARVSASGN